MRGYLFPVDYPVYPAGGCDEVVSLAPLLNLVQRSGSFTFRRVKNDIVGVWTPWPLRIPWTEVIFNLYCGVGGHPRSGP
jgi:hypothetical protein